MVVASHTAGTPRRTGRELHTTATWGGGNVGGGGGGGVYFGGNG